MDIPIFLCHSKKENIMHVTKVFREIKNNVRLENWCNCNSFEIMIITPSI